MVDENKPGYAELIDCQKHALQIALDKSITVYCYHYQQRYRLSSKSPTVYLSQRPQAKFMGDIKATSPRKI
jgi:hypothetical protein